MRMVDCQGLAGHGIILGGVQAGFELVHRTALPGGFGNEVVEENAELLGGGFDIETDPQEEWTAMKNVAYVAGVPPCSGFSLMNTSAAAAKARGKDTPANARGPGSAINECQRELVRYAARTRGTDGRAGAEFVVFESVQGAFSQGLELMREYWTMLTAMTRQPYQLTHVLMSVGSIGGAQGRHRYFFVAHRVPFGIGPFATERVTTLLDVIGDLREQPEMWDPQDYVVGPNTDHEKRLRGRAVLNHDAHGGNSLKPFEPLMPYWEPGKAIQTATKAFIADQGIDALPEKLRKRWNPETELYRGFMWPRRLAWDEVTGVLAGSCAVAFIHPDHDRFLTVRELARVMDIPDDWAFYSAKHAGHAGSWIGKNCTTGAGRWIAEPIRDALAGTPQPTDHEWWFEGHYPKRDIELADGERVYDITNEYRRLPNFVRHKR